MADHLFRGELGYLGGLAAEMAFVLVVARRKGAALRAHWLDAAIVVVTVPAYGRLLSSLRLVRLVRLLRLFRAGVLISRALQAERRRLRALSDSPRSPPSS